MYIAYTHLSYNVKLCGRKILTDIALFFFRVYSAFLSVTPYENLKKNVELTRNRHFMTEYNLVTRYATVGGKSLLTSTESRCSQEEVSCHK